MKLVFSWNCRLGVIFLLFIDVSIAIASICFCNNSEDAVFLGLFNLFYASLTSFLIYKIRNCLTFVEITDKGFSTSILNRNFCYVDKNKPVYYAVVSGERSRKLHSYDQLIIISNEPIDKKVTDNVIYNSKLKKHIIMPCNADILIHCETDKWNNVNLHK